VPNGEVPAGAGDVAVSHGIAIREQHGGRGFIRLDAHGVDREHIGAVDEIGDAAEALRLALRAVGAARTVEAGKGGVRLRVAERDDLVKVHLLDQIVGGCIILEEFGPAIGLLHGDDPLPSLLEGGAKNASPKPRGMTSGDAPISGLRRIQS
jgi:hypothetical protein